MKPIIVSPLPDQALLTAYRARKAYTDCFSVEIPHQVSLAQYIEAFYTTPLFKLERFILTILVRKPSTDVEVRLMACGESDTFAAWTVEGRADDQIMLCDYLGKTRSWLMCSALANGTRLYFGSAIVPKRVSATGQVSLGLGFRLLLGFHRIYARALLKSAANRVSWFQV